MGVEKLYEGKTMIMWRGSNNADFIRFIAKRAAVYAFHPTVNEFCMQLRGPEDAYKFARNKLVYRKDPRIGEKILSPAYIIELWREGKRVLGDCDDKTLFLASCLANMGYHVNVVGGLFNKPGATGINHVYVEFLNDQGEWISLEPSTKILGFGAKSPRVTPMLKVRIKEPSMSKVSNMVDFHGTPEKDNIGLAEEALWEI